MRGAGIVRSCWPETGAEKGWRCDKGGAAGGPERSCVAAVLSCLQDSDGAGMITMVIAVSMFVTVGRRRAAGEPGGSLSK